MQTCIECGVEKALDSFYKNPNMRNGHLNRCKPCFRNRYRDGRSQRQKNRLAYIQRIKVERGCTDCGYNANAAALDFDHLPQFTKTYRIATMAAGSTRAKIDAEIAKCEVVCANCHRIRTAERRGVDLAAPDPTFSGFEAGGEAFIPVGTPVEWLDAPLSAETFKQIEPCRRSFHVLIRDVVGSPVPRITWMSSNSRRRATDVTSELIAAQLGRRN